jgi:hypothetical protein
VHGNAEFLADDVEAGEFDGGVQLGAVVVETGGGVAARVASSPPPPISPSPTKPSAVSTSTTVRTKRPQCAPLLCSSGASSGTVTGVARIEAIVVADIVRSVAGAPERFRRGKSRVAGLRDSNLRPKNW